MHLKYQTQGFGDERITTERKLPPHCYCIFLTVKPEENEVVEPTAIKRTQPTVGNLTRKLGL